MTYINGNKPTRGKDMDNIINNIYNVLTRERNNASEEMYKRFYAKIIDAVLTLITNGIINNNDELIKTLQEFHPNNI